jgi:hypothetical protein
MCLKEIGWDVAVWIYAGQDRDKYQGLVTIVMKLQISQNAGNFLTG